MGSRNNHIVVSDDEKQALNDVAEQKFGTSDVEYGAIVSALTTDYLDND